MNDIFIFLTVCLIGLGSVVIIREALDEKYE